MCNYDYTLSIVHHIMHNAQYVDGNLYFFEPERDPQVIRVRVKLSYRTSLDNLHNYQYDNMDHMSLKYYTFGVSD